MSSETDIALAELDLLTMDEDAWPLMRELEVVKGRAAQVIASIDDIQYLLLRVKDKEKFKCA